MTTMVANEMIQRIATPRAVAMLILAAFAVLAMTVFPGFGPSVEAAQAKAPLVRSERVAGLGANCAKEDWPNISAACLRQSTAQPVTSDVRVVTIR